ncbi:non-hydrolyzing UDP-N-acetylglucosamine 2-epimerase [Acidovorax sp.]|uniref:non-hydrolyzing UDP-N-acetylglucosamine 2-epimerase n=1 Tax=Acidovorax sp. TaxID=1872122 RepID=UPI00391F9D23
MTRRKILTIVGARPQFIKAAAVSRTIQSGFADRLEELIVHTGQHFDDNMSKVFFDELEIPTPHVHLAISGGNHGAMTGRMLEAIEAVLLRERPDWVLVYGDTNSTLAGALAAAKLNIPVAHVEAGLRSFNMRMPEEVNRILTDRVSTLLLCPTSTAVGHLAHEGLSRGVHLVGDVMYDASLFYGSRALQRSSILAQLQLTQRRYVLATCHRAENTDDPSRLTQIVEALVEVAQDMPVVLPLHPRTRRLVEVTGLQSNLCKLRVVEPLSYLDMVALEQAAAVIMTDSGGVQKEAYFYRVPCITLRDETEWVETVTLGWNRLTGATKDRILLAYRDVVASAPPASGNDNPYGNGDASARLLQLLT